MNIFKLEDDLYQAKVYKIGFTINDDDYNSTDLSFDMEANNFEECLYYFKTWLEVKHMDVDSVVLNSIEHSHNRKEIRI